MLTSRYPESGVTELPARAEERAAGAALPPRLRPPLRGGGVLRLERRRPGRGQAGGRGPDRGGHTHYWGKIFSLNWKIF